MRVALPACVNKETFFCRKGCFPRKWLRQQPLVRYDIVQGRLVINHVVCLCRLHVDILTGKIWVAKAVPVSTRVMSIRSTDRRVMRYLMSYVATGHGNPRLHDSFLLFIEYWHTDYIIPFDAIDGR